MTDLTPIQKEIVTALEQMKEKSLITEANLAKKVRENSKISGKNKAGICLKDLEVCIEYLCTKCVTELCKAIFIKSIKAGS